ncbi:PH domain-containing protein [Fodinicola acaciae]|uniref:PH domain-containing protein n=1 Tax=Fodinicola acaciae TaxID=2681555 RepID=UPI0013D39B73|nr:PH domain-containing protein [Fodinicola acaciae]
MNEPTTATLAEASGLRLRTPQHLVSRRAIGFWTIKAAIGWLVLLVAQVVPLVVSQGYLSWLYATIAATVVVGVAHSIVMPQWRYRVHRWQATGEAVYTQAGWINQEYRVAPISRIQTVDTARGPLEQLFKLAKVTITTASSAGPVSIVGLDSQEAARLVDELTTTTQATRGDAT